MSAEQLKKENADLEAQIAKLRKQLGIFVNPDEKEKKRIRRLFDLFDVDKNGTIDKEEFEVLAYECGEIQSLTPQGIKDAFAVLNPKGDGKITFDSFYDWLKSKKKNQEDNAQIGLLRVKLQSKVWARKFKRVQKQFKEFKSAQEKKTDNEEKKDVPLNKEFKVNFQIGEFDDPGLSLTFSAFSDKQKTDELRAKVNCPAEVTAFARILISAKDYPNKEKLLELVGALDMIVAQLVQSLGQMAPAYTLNYSEGENALEVVLLSPVDPYAILQQISGFEDESTMLFKTQTKLELPASLKEMHSAPKLKKEFFKIRFNTDSSLNQQALQSAQDAVARLGQPLLKYRLAFFDFFQGFNFDVHLLDAFDLAATVDEAERNNNATRQLQAAIAADNAMPAFTQNIAAQLAAGCAQFGIDYDSILQLKGLHSIQIVVRDQLYKLRFKGFGIFECL